MSSMTILLIERVKPTKEDRCDVSATLELLDDNTVFHSSILEWWDLPEDMLDTIEATAEDVFGEELPIVRLNQTRAQVVEFQKLAIIFTEKLNAFAQAEVQLSPEDRTKARRELAKLSREGNRPRKRGHKRNRK